MEEEVFAKQVAAEYKNAQKSEERKKNQKRKQSEAEKEDQPPSKKAKKTNSIPLSDGDLEAIRTFFWTAVDYNPLVDKVGLRSGLSNEVMYFGAYPILLAPAQRVAGNLVATEYVLGVSKPQYVLGGLRKIFEKRYPDKNAVEFTLWDVYKWNRAYYGVRVEKVSYNSDIYEYQCVETKPFGGPKDQPTVHWSEETKLSRWKKAIKIEEYFKDKNPNRMHNPRIPDTAKPWPSDYLARIAARVEELKKSMAKAEAAAEDKLNDKAIRETMNNLADDSDDEDSDE